MVSLIAFSSVSAASVPTESSPNRIKVDHHRFSASSFVAHDFARSPCDSAATWLSISESKVRAGVLRPSTIRKSMNNLSTYGSAANGADPPGSIFGAGGLSPD